MSTDDYLIKSPTLKNHPPQPPPSQENGPFVEVRMLDIEEAEPESLLIDLSDNEIK